MKRFAPMFALALLVAACGDVDLSTSDTTPPETAPATTAATAAAVEETVPSDDHGDDADSHEEDSSDRADDEHADDADSHDDDSADHADDDHDDVGIEADRTVEVAMNEFFFAPGEFEATAGETIEFVVTNLGVVEHEFRLSNGHRIEEHIAEGHADHEDASEGGHHEGGDVILLVEPGGTDSITVTFGEDATLYSEVACLIPGHYEAGMKAPMRLSA